MARFGIATAVPALVLLLACEARALPTHSGAKWNSLTAENKDGPAPLQADRVGPQPLKVEIFYETLCPHCHDFIAQNLASVWNDTELRSRIDVKLYPYGNARTVSVVNVSDGYKYWHKDVAEKGLENVFNCQHGQEECFGNMLQACAIDRLSDLQRSIPFIACMEGMPESSAERSSYACSKRLGVDLDPIKSCTMGKEGNRLMQKIGNYTRGLQAPAGPQNYVPWVVLGGNHSKEAELDAQPNATGHLLRQICGLLSPPRPASCTNATSALTAHDGAFAARPLMAALALALPYLRGW